ncbi:hypothetical protein BD289DRAFT_450787 [Coniella lustricola]|uniref:DUF952 domain-containing protein n=1 Tax=Coniella lustricola TaxID=2025994 RepID=A0A2T3AHE4_9PEZI|nr:hypothetical protein BD289DRAFT_450787 [Coniella lustricola]
MPAPSVLPEFVYKIVDSAPPSPLPRVFPPSDLDKQDGFIHLSTGRQVPITAGLFFASHTTLWLIKIRLAALTAEPATGNMVKWDDPPNDNDGCPHLYGNFGAVEVDSVQEFERKTGCSAGGYGQDEEWKDVFAASKWLE